MFVCVCACIHDDKETGLLGSDEDQSRQERKGMSAVQKGKRR